MQTISSALTTEIEDGAQSVVPKVVVEWQNSRQVTNVLGLSSSDDYDSATLRMSPSIYTKLNEGRYSEVVVADNPLSYWKLDDTSGTVAVDTMGYQNGIYNGTPTLSQASILDPSGFSVDFNGSSQYMQFSDYSTGVGKKFVPGNTYGPAAFSIEAWINLDALGSVRTSPIFSVSSYYSFCVDLDGTLALIANQGWQLNGTTILALSTWYHVVMVFDGHACVLYVNGKQDGIKTFLPTQNGFDLSISKIWHYGTVGTYEGGTDFFNGKMDDIAYYQYDLTAAQIYEHYAAGIGIAADYSGQGALGTYLGNPSIGQSQGPLNVLTPVYDASGSASGASVSTLKWSHTISGNNNRMLIVGLSTQKTVAPATFGNVTIDGILMTRYVPASTNELESGSNLQIEMFYILESQLPPAGTYQIVANTTGSVTSFAGGSTSFYNVAQLPPESIASSTTPTDGTTNSLSLTPINPNTVVIDIVAGGTGAATLTSGTNLKKVDVSSTGNLLGMSVSSVGSTVASTTMSWTASTSMARWAHVVFALRGVQKIPSTAPILDGTNDCITLTPPVDPINNFSFEAWVFVNTHPGTGNRGSAVCKASGSTIATTQYGIDVVGTGASTSNLAGYVCAGSTRYEVTSTSNIVLGRWYYVMVSVNNSLVSMYLNTVSQGTPVTFAGSINIGGLLAIGRQGSSATQFFNGRVANFALYNSVSYWNMTFSATFARYTSGICASLYNNPFGTADELVNGRIDNNHTWAQTEAFDSNDAPVTFNGKMALAESQIQTKSYQFEYGWQSSNVTDGSGVFTQLSPLATVFFDSIQADSVVVTFPSAYGRVKQLTVYYISTANALTTLGSFEIEQNQTSIEIPFSSRISIKGLAVLPTKTWVPFDRARVSEIIPMIREDISVDVVSCAVNKVKENFDSTVPFGATGANDLQLVLQDVDLKYNAQNASSPVYGWLDIDTPIDVSLGWAGTGGPNGLSLNGTTGYASTPSKNHLRITADIDLIGKVAMADWTPSASQTIVGKWLTSGNQKSYALQVTSTGVLRLAFSADGSTTITKDSTVATGLVDGSIKWVRATIDVDNGASGYDVKFYLGDDGISWTQLGTTVTTATATSIFSSTAEVDVGATDGGTANWFAGTIYRAKIRNSLTTGSYVVDVDFVNDPTLATQTTFYDGIQTWTLSGGSTLISGGTEYVKQGRYYTDSWNSDTSSQTTTVVARDASKFLQEASTDEGVVVYNSTASKAIAAMAKTGKIGEAQVDIDYPYSERVLRDNPIMFHRYNLSALDGPAVSFFNNAYLNTIRPFNSFPSDNLTLETWSKSTAVTFNGAIASSVVSGSSTTDGTSFVTANYAPDVGGMYILCIANTHASAAPIPSSITGSGVSWTEAGQELAVGSLSMVSIWYGIGLSSTPAAITINYSTTQTSCHWSVLNITGADITGSNGVNGIGSVTSNTASAATSIGLTGASANPTDCQIIAAFENQNSTNLAPEAGWTELSDTTQSTPSGDMAVAWRRGQDTTPSYSSSTSGIWAAVSVTIKAAKQPIFNYGTSTSVNEFSLDILSSGELLVTKGANTFTTSGAALIDDTWHSLAVTFTTSSSGAVNVFKDGKNIGSGTLNTTAINPGGFVSVGAKMTTFSATAPVYANTKYTNIAGYIKDLRIWKAIRPAPGADASASLAGNEYGLVVNWKMNENTPGDGVIINNSTDSFNIMKTVGYTYWILDGINSLKDSAGNNNASLDGDLFTFGITSPITSEVTTAVKFQGEFCHIPYNSTFDLTSTLTFEAWINPDSTGAGTTRWLFLKNTSTLEYGFGISTSEKFFFYGAGVANFNSIASIPANTWTHVAVTVNSAITNGMSIYINGILDSSATASGPITPTNSVVYIGTGPYTGYIGSMALWNRTLSASDIAEHKRSSLTPLQKQFTALWSDPTGTLWDSMLQVALADLGMFTMTETNTFRYESGTTLYNNQFNNHVVSQWNLHQNKNIATGTQLLELLVNKVVVKVNPVISPTTAITELWTAPSNESLAASTLRIALLAGEQTQIGYYSTLNTAGVRVPVFPESGYVKIGQEIIKYDSRDDLYMYGLTRGQFNTLSAAHGINDFIGETREYNMAWTTTPALLVKYPFITAQIFDNTVDVELWNSSPKQGHLVISLKPNFDPLNIYQVLSGTNPLNQLVDSFVVAGLGNSTGSSTGVQTEIEQDFGDKIRRYGVKDIQIDNPFIQDTAYAKSIANYVLTHNNVMVPIISLNTIGIPQLQLGDRVTVQQFDQLSLTNIDYWIQNIVITYDGSAQTVLTLKRAV